jgi:hypothetical protein
VADFLWAEHVTVRFGSELKQRLELRQDTLERGHWHLADGLANQTLMKSEANVTEACEVIATYGTLGRVALSESGDTTSAGRCLSPLRSANGNGTRTTLLRL